MVQSCNPMQLMTGIDDDAFKASETNRGRGGSQSTTARQRKPRPTMTLSRRHPHRSIGKRPQYSVGKDNNCSEKWGENALYLLCR